MRRGFSRRGMYIAICGCENKSSRRTQVGPITIATLICLVAALEAVGQTGPKAAGDQVLKCVDLDRSACTSAQVSELEMAAGPKAAGHQVLKCEDLNGKACTWAQVSELETAAISGEDTHKALGTFRQLTLAWFDGTLKCEQTDRTACSAEQVRSLNHIAAAMKLRVWYRFGGALSKR